MILQYTKLAFWNSTESCHFKSSFCIVFVFCIFTVRIETIQLIFKGSQLTGFYKSDKNTESINFNGTLDQNESSKVDMSFREFCFSSPFSVFFSNS